MSKYNSDKKLGCQFVGNPDDYSTPSSALDILIPYLKPHARVWECASGVNMMVDSLRERGYDVIGTTKFSGDYQPNINYFSLDFINQIDAGNDIASGVDYIITNPPYSLKNEFIHRCYEIGKPFALLLPLTALEGKKRQLDYVNHGLQLIIPNKRINFITPSGKGIGSYFTTAWFTHGLNLKHDITFVKSTW